ncbi:sialate O-acetylesterase [Wenyingzhuangia sp. 1_MG-2023]|nr:sialate O-acetylesterase [Wenyingzhuangia sp. 1_MG-2023]
MKKVISFLSTLTIASCSLAIEDYDAPYDIIIIAGQSNTHHGLGLDPILDQPDANIFQLGRSSIYNHLIFPAKEPLQHHTASTNRIGFGLTFAKEYNQKINPNKKPILIIPCGYGGSSLKDDWKFDDFLYQDMIEHVKFVQQKFPKSVVKAFLWHQGESDVGNNGYANLLDTFINQVRTDLEQEIPVIVGGMVPYWVSQTEDRIQQQNSIKDTPNRLENVSYADPEIPFVISKLDNSVDAIHYNAAGQRELGKRYFEAYNKLIE